MATFYATLYHHSISRARGINVEGTLTQAKRSATREFQGDFNFYYVEIFEDGRLVANRRLSANRWTNYK